MWLSLGSSVLVCSVVSNCLTNVLRIYSLIDWFDLSTGVMHWRGLKMITDVEKLLIR